MIEPTDEMVEAAVKRLLATSTLDSIAQIDAGMRQALAVVLAIVERDYDIRPRPAEPAWHEGCSGCWRTVWHR